jgi:PilZ domain
MFPTDGREPLQLLSTRIREKLKSDKQTLSDRFLAESMQAVSFPARQTRTHYRHELRTLTYVTLDDANGGIIRNLNHEGVAIQAVAPLHEQQRVRLRFELRYPRLRVDAYGQVSWASPSGQCGIRFVDMPAHTGHQINEWIFSNLLNEIAREAKPPRLISGAAVVSIAREESLSEDDDGMILSASSRPAIRLGPVTAMRDETASDSDLADLVAETDAQLNWLSRPLSGRTLAWLVDSLVVTTALLLFTLIFLSIAHELPPWPLTLGTASGAAVFVATAYWSMFAFFGGPSLGVRLAQGVESKKEEDDDAGRFR